MKIYLYGQNQEDNSPYKIPEGFCYLEDIDPTILQEIRYAGYHNFVGRPIDGYKANRCIVSNALGQALVEVQKEAGTHGMNLKVYDAYRPLRAAQDFVEWAIEPADQKMKDEFYPDINKADIFKLGFIAVRSQHSRGSAVDLTLVPKPVPAQDTYQPGDTLKDSRLPKATRFNDNSIDMGTGFDCFDARAHTASPDLPDQARNNRLLLKDMMERHGFANYENEWWHFSLLAEPFPYTYFDFPIR